MRGPGACPGWGWLALRIREPHRHHNPTRTSTRPPPFPTSTPCPYRAETFILFHSRFRSAKIIRMGPRTLHYPIQSSKFIMVRAVPHPSYTGRFFRNAPVAEVVILSAAKDLAPGTEILRCAQDDSSHLAGAFPKNLPV